MFESMQTALLGLMNFQHLGFMFLGIVVGLCVGILPGLGGIAGMSLLMPFIYGMDPVSAIAMLIGMVAVIPTGDTFTSVLMGIPGSSASQATVLDGYPLAKKGQAARALSAAFSASLLGGVFGAVMLTGFVVVARPIILIFSTAELFMLAVLGLSVVGILSGNSMIRGLAACGLGIVVGAIGTAPATGEARIDLGFDYLMDGVPLVIVGLGLFAIPELADLMRRPTSIASGSTLGAGWLQGVKDTFRHWFLVLRSSALGTFIGFIPGLGGGVVDWLAYGHAVQSSNDKSQYGKGEIKGVIAPESANNALQGGALMPTLLFGRFGLAGFAAWSQHGHDQSGPHLHHRLDTGHGQHHWGFHLFHVGLSNFTLDVHPVQSGSPGHDHADLLCGFPGKTRHCRSFLVVWYGHFGRISASVWLATSCSSDWFCAVTAS